VTLTRAQLAALAPADLQRVLALAEQIEQDQQTGKVPWICDVPDCDGRPHPGRMGNHARAPQRWPDPKLIDYDVWLLLAGRGFGKTRCGAEWSVDQARQFERGALVGATAADTRDIMVEGESGIIACAPATFRPLYEPSKRKLTYPNGAIQMLYSADEPDRLRGPQHHYGWADELAAWRRIQYAWDMLQMGMRLGQHPQVCVTTTPRPLSLVKELLKSPMSAVVRGSTYDNLHNLAPTFQRTVVAKYEGTTLGRQELNADILDDLPGALLLRSVLDRNRVAVAPTETLLKAVAMDPAGTGLGDETGLVAGCVGADRHAYLTHDRSAKMTPKGAADAAWQLLDDTDADVLVYEDNFGKGWVKEVLTKAWEDRKRKQGISHPGHPPLVSVWASAGKQLRAQPTVLRHEQGLVHHVGVFPELEDQYTTWIPEETPTKSPDRVDAAVHLDAYFAKRFGTVQVSAPVLPHERLNALMRGASPSGAAAMLNAMRKG
jgi:phage terminase large subunit-like protein